MSKAKGYRNCWVPLRVRTKNMSYNETPTKGKNMTVTELKIYRELESDPSKMCIYSGGRDINELSTEEFIMFVHKAAMEG